MRVRVVTLRRAPAHTEPVTVLANGAGPDASLGHDGTTDLCSYFDARARSRAVDPLQREAVASVRLPR